MDLDIENYGFEDILQLFEIDTANYTIDDLKRAKQIVASVHPDRSKLSAEYFIFFKRAFQILAEVHRQRVHAAHDHDSMESLRVDEDSTEAATHTLYEKHVPKDCKEFHLWFNKMFEDSNESSNESSNDNGYGEWFAGEDSVDTNDTTAKTPADMARIIDSKKRALQALVSTHTVNDFMSPSSHASALGGGTPEIYEGGLFTSGGGLAFDDLKRAYTETVVPVTEADFEARQKFGSTDDLARYRAKIISRPTEAEHRSELARRADDSGKEDAKRMYDLTVEAERTARVNAMWMSKLMMLE